MTRWLHNTARSVHQIKTKIGNPTDTASNIWADYVCTFGDGSFYDHVVHSRFIALLQLAVSTDVQAMSSPYTCILTPNKGTGFASSDVSLQM